VHVQAFLSVLETVASSKNVDHEKTDPMLNSRRLRFTRARDVQSLDATRGKPVANTARAKKPCQLIEIDLSPLYQIPFDLYVKRRQLDHEMKFPFLLAVLDSRERIAGHPAIDKNDRRVRFFDVLSRPGLEAR
jgi:hypothetical protein